MNGTFFDNKLTELYVDLNRIPYEKERYRKAIDSYKTFFGEGEIEIFSAPGRSEIGGNHTDHQHGEVLAKIGQYAENVYFGKPCGLMEQMACTVVFNYQKEMDKIFGNGSCEVLKIRKYGGIKVL